MLQYLQHSKMHTIITVPGSIKQLFIRFLELLCALFGHQQISQIQKAIGDEEIGLVRDMKVSTLCALSILGEMWVAGL